MHSEYESKMLESGGFDRGTGWVNLGVIRIDNETFMDDLNSIYMNSIYLDSVFISLVKYSSGLFAVTLYIYLSDAATGSVKSVIPPRMTDFIRLNSFNIFSRKQFGSHLLMEDNHCESYLMERKQKVYDEAWKFFDILKKEIGIKRNNDEVYCVSDVYLDQDFPYFERNSGSDRHEKFILLPKMRHFSDVKLSSNKDESFVADKYFNINGIDLTYMKIRPHSTFDKYDDFKKNTVQMWNHT
ncbi:hypothetical protein SMQE13_28250 [Serratia marcescens]|nr:hypothetical protein SMQE13_28250 [Serratia marcescens]